MSSQSPTPPPTQTHERKHHGRETLEEYERSDSTRPAFLLTWTEIKLLGIAGVGFLLDAYDLFIINPVATMLQHRLYPDSHIPPGLEGFLKAGANIGSVIGQFLFGYLADSLGRKAVYGKELMLIIFATIMCLTTPTGQLTADSSIVYLGVWRIILGVGVGGDYPMSATITSDRANIRKRGTLLAYIFSNQGWGSLLGSLITIIVLMCYKSVMENGGNETKLDGVWRIIVGVSLVPAFGTLYQRLTLPESTRFKKSREQQNDEVDLEELKARNNSGSEEAVIESAKKEQVDQNDNEKEKAHLKDFIDYFSEWRHAKHLIGTSVCWFLLDIAFYGINLNQNVVLQQIGYDGSASATAWHKLFNVSTGGIIITVLGFVPGYYASILTIEWLGRKWIQIQGFLMAALFLAILAAKFTALSHVSFIVCFAFLQFFFNFGANTTTYCYPAELFPTRFKAFAHGLSAAAGKAGAIISALAFNQLSKSIGTPKVLWIFVACCIAGAFFTLLLPEVKGRDADAVYREEMKEKRGI